MKPMEERKPDQRQDHPVKDAFNGETSFQGIRKPCVRCLLEDMPSQAALARTVRELVELIPEEDRADEKTVRLRLADCRECPSLGMGTCRLCGCYVEHRAAKKRTFCPAVPSRWKV